MKNVIYTGRRIPSVIVLVTDEDSKQARRLDPKPSQAIYNHSPTGFEWGYGGSGAAQLSLALLLDAIESTGQTQLPSTETSDVLAQRWYQVFKNDFVSNWGDDTWRISLAEIIGWLIQVMAQAETKRKSYSHEPQFPPNLMRTEGGNMLLG